MRAPFSRPGGGGGQKKRGVGQASVVVPYPPTHFHEIRTSPFRESPSSESVEVSEQV
jgi:hypothetical protein